MAVVNEETGKRFAILDSKTGKNVRLAMEELEFFTSYLRVLGIYRASPHRAEIARRWKSYMDEYGYTSEE